MTITNADSIPIKKNSGLYGDNGMFEDASLQKMYEKSYSQLGLILMKIGSYPFFGT